MAYPTNTNNRIFYATQAVAVGDRDASAVIDSWSPGNTVIAGTGKVMIAHGVQSIGVTTNFNLEQIFELGQLSLYENYEEIPEIEVSFEKVLDGYSLLYHCGTVTATDPTLPGRGTARADVRMAVGFDTNSYMASGANSGVAELYCSGMYISSVSYNLGTDGNFTESTTFVGNNKLWITGTETSGNLLTNDDGSLNGVFTTGIFKEDAPVGVGNSVLRRQNVVIGTGGMAFANGNSTTTLTTQVPNVISSTGTAGTLTNTLYITDLGPYLQSVSISCDLGREAIQQLGRKTPYFRYVNFPVDVTCDIEITATEGDNVDAYEEGYPSGVNGVAIGKNLKDHSIQIVLDDSTVFQLGKKNKLTNISYGGGDAGGGNATITYSFTNSNDFVVLHSGDPAIINASGYFKNWFE